MRPYVLFIILLLAVSHLWAAARISFVYTEYDFGTVYEDHGDVVAHFPFVNTGDQPLMVKHVASGCGCTIPRFSMHYIAPGDSGVIDIVYHARGRLGPFRETVFAYDNINGKTRLSISGEVVPGLSIEEIYSCEMGGGLRATTRQLSFGDVFYGRPPVTRVVDLYNANDYPIEVAASQVPRCIQHEILPVVIPAHDLGQLHLSFLTEQSNDWGRWTDAMQLHVKDRADLLEGLIVQQEDQADQEEDHTRSPQNDDTLSGQAGHTPTPHKGQNLSGLADHTPTPQKDQNPSSLAGHTLTLSAVIREDFSHLSQQQRQQAPRIDASSTSLALHSKQCKQSIIIKNMGQNDLIIRKVANSLPQIFKVQLSRSTIHPGKSATLTVTFLPKHCLSSTLNHHISLICNDPITSSLQIHIQADR